MFSTLGVLLAIPFKLDIIGITDCGNSLAVGK
jgi:hypothetical protein